MRVKPATITNIGFIALGIALIADKIFSLPGAIYTYGTAGVFILIGTVMYFIKK